MWPTAVNTDLISHFPPATLEAWPVMGFCSPKDYQRFIHQVPMLERGLVESGIRLFKLWFDVSRREQRRRIQSVDTLVEQFLRLLRERFLSLRIFLHHTSPSCSRNACIARE